MSPRCRVSACSAPSGSRSSPPRLKPPTGNAFASSPRCCSKSDHAPMKRVFKRLGRPPFVERQQRDRCSSDRREQDRLSAAAGKEAVELVTGKRNPGNNGGAAGKHRGGFVPRRRVQIDQKPFRRQARRFFARQQGHDLSQLPNPCRKQAGENDERGAEDERKKESDIRKVDGNGF